MKTKFEKKESELMNKNPNNWKWIFYYNPKDPRAIVPKMNPSFGWTLNFGNKYTYIGLAVIVIIIVAYMLFL